MDQGRFGRTSKERYALEQGKYGENNASHQDNSWVCPQCETINTENTCLLCGYVKGNFNRPANWKKLAVVLPAILLLAAGILAMIPNGWRTSDGEYSYYRLGRKTTGKVEIDGDWYFFNEEGVMHTGWKEESGRDYYYGTDGRMVTGYREINGVEYYFSENGAERVLKNVVTTKVVGTSVEHVEFQLDNGNKTWGTSRVLLTPAAQCTYIHVNLEITKVEQGNADGKWQLSVRGGSDQKEWIHLAEFEVNNGKGECIVTLAEPISLEAFVCTRIENDSWSGQTNQKLSEIRYIQIGTTTAPIYETIVVPSEISASSTDAWKNNILMKNPHTQFAGVGKDAITSVTFVDTFAGIPKNARDVSESQNGSVLAWMEKNGEYYDLYIAGEGGINAASACKELFAGYQHLETVHFNECFYTDNATSMESMFHGCGSLTSLDVSNFDTSNVTSMHHMFYGCRNISVLDVSRWDTSKVTDMGNMFRSCHSLTMLDVSSWDTSNVTNMGNMFYVCKELSALDVREWDTSNVKYMNHMFESCDSLATLDVSSWDISNVTGYNGFMDDGKLLNSRPWIELFE